LRPAQLKAAVAAAGGHFLKGLEVDVLHWILTTLPFGIIVYLCVAGLAHAIRYFIEARERDVQVARLSEQLAGARFAALQAQLNPHFLFNTLNTIAVRARDGDTAGTVGMVEQLSDVLRRTLTRHRVNEVTLEEELGLARQYLAIEQARFSDRLRASFEIDESLLPAAVPSFALQHLVENAIRHGIARRSGAGQVIVRAHRVGDTLELSVADDGPGVNPDAARRPGHGIENTQERLRALYGERASLVVARAPGGGTVAILRVPLREMPLESDLAGQ
jgi:LytS/YehU family sensor histidine kinase